jgi:hypothetical protein
LCARQCARWQGAPQYSAVLQRPQEEVEGAAQPSAQQRSGAWACDMIGGQGLALFLLLLPVFEE